MSPSLLRDMQKLSGEHQASVVEAFHSLIVQFAPKSLVFSFSAMKCRLELAALHYNENSGRCQARTKEGRLQYQVRYPKYKRGVHIVQRRQVAATFFWITLHTAYKFATGDISKLHQICHVQTYYTRSLQVPSSKQLSNYVCYNVIFAPGYVDSMMDSVIRISQNEDTDITPLQAEPPPLCASYSKPHKDEAVAVRTTRFKSQ